MRAWDDTEFIETMLEGFWVEGKLTVYTLYAPGLIEPAIVGVDDETEDIEDTSTLCCVGLIFWYNTRQDFILEYNAMNPEGDNDEIRLIVLEHYFPRIDLYAHKAQEYVKGISQTGGQQ
ncbi:hypothetical protein AWENTII_005200 [Aspergillus wentii]